MAVFMSGVFYAYARFSRNSGVDVYASTTGGRDCMPCGNFPDISALSNICSNTVRREIKSRKIALTL